MVKVKERSKFLKVFIVNIIFFIINLSFNHVFAKVVHIRVDEARDFGVKLAVIPYELSKKTTELSKITEIISNDLNYSGQFKVLSLNLNDSEIINKLPINNNNFKKLDFKFWKDTGVEYLLITKMYPANEAQQLVINLQLIDLYKPLDPICLNAEVIKYPNEKLNIIAHRASDIIFQQLIGTKSFFKTKVAYIRAERLAQIDPEYSLNIADFDGSNEHKLITANYPLMSPSWSPDGKKIAFVSFKGNRSSINIVDLELRKSTLISRYPGINGAPAWSPNGEQLAMVLSKDGNPSIYLLNLVTGNLNKLTKGIGIDTEPCWSKDGQEIFFTSNRCGKPQIYKISLVTEKITRITFKGEYNATPSITPDNKYLVMLHCYENCSKTKSEFSIALQSLDNGRVKILTKTGMEDSPTLSPNGFMIIYSTKANKDSDRVLAKVSIEGNFYKYLPIIGNGSLKSPAWSPYLE